MIVIRAEIWPFGDGDQAYEIGIIFAWNEGLDAPLSTYSGTVAQDGYEVAGVQQWTRDFQIHGQDRSHGPWRLVAAILAEIEAPEAARGPACEISPDAVWPGDTPMKSRTK